ncbi:MAG: hypothetical protein JRH16_16110 [Deltaproteobacteria bacterium]|nr:hypothetical protein [Deltaproteobacteria bacterium]
MRLALALLLLLALLSACGRVGPPVRSRATPPAPAVDVPAPAGAEPDDADEEKPS